MDEVAIRERQLGICLPEERKAKVEKAESRGISREKTGATVL